MKRASVSTDEERPLKAAQTWVSCDTRRLENIPVSCRQSGEGDDVEVQRIEWARDVKEGVVLTLV